MRKIWTYYHRHVATILGCISRNIFIVHWIVFLHFIERSTTLLVVKPIYRMLVDVKDSQEHNDTYTRQYPSWMRNVKKKIIGYTTSK
jgi:hypothetical protein